MHIGAPHVLGKQGEKARFLHLIVWRTPYGAHESERLKVDRVLVH